MTRILAERTVGTMLIVACVVTFVTAYQLSTTRIAGQVETARGSSLSFQPMWSAATSPNADSSPIYVKSVRLTNGRHVPAVYVLAGNNGADCNPGSPVTRATLYAFNARTGSRLWTRSTTGPSRCTTSSPVAYQNWVYAAGLDGKVHRYVAGTGNQYRKHGWPITVSRMPDVEKLSAALTVGTDHLYVTTSGFIGDQGHYEGHLVTINLSTFKTNVFNTLCSNIHKLLGTPGPVCSAVRSALFGRGQGVVDPVNHDVWIVTGNGPWDGHTNWGDSILKLDPSGKRLLDAFTPTNQQSLNDSDQDLGSTGPALLPTIHQSGHTYHLLVQGGKGPACDSCRGVALRLLNRDDLSGKGGPGHLGGDLQDVQSPGGCVVLTAPAVWKHSGRIWVYYANDCGTAAFKLSSSSPGHFQLQSAWSDGTSGSSPILSGGVLYVAHDGSLLARNPATGKVIGQTSIGGIHWEYPVVADGAIYITDENGRLSAFSLKS